MQAVKVNFENIDDALETWHRLRSRQNVWPKIKKVVDALADKLGKISRIHIPESQSYIGVTFGENSRQIGAYINQSHIDHIAEIPGSINRADAPKYWRTLIDTSTEESDDLDIELPPWKPHKDSEQRKSSAVASAMALLASRESITTPHLKELLSITIWKHTECDGKYKTRYQSLGALSRQQEKLNHEHVVQRKLLVEALLKDPTRCQEIFESAIACTVLEEEHKKIMQIEKTQSNLFGWDRYRAANIVVYDLLTKSRIV